MATNFVDRVTPIDATAMNGIEDEIEEVRGGVSDLNTSVSELNSSITNCMKMGYCSTKEALLSWLPEITNLRPVGFVASGAASSYLTNGNSSSTYLGIAYRSGTSCYNYFIASGNSNYLYYGRTDYATNELLYLRRVAGESIL